MYGLVNKAIQDLVCEKFGEEQWIKIKTMSGFEDDFFIGLQSYPDEITYKLVKNASIVLGADSSVVLEAFGEYWILYTVNEGYGEMMDLAGDNFPDFLENLDLLHERINNIMPKLRAPQFSTQNRSGNAIELEYRSERAGMLPMLYGLLKGLAKRFNVDPIEITHLQIKGEGNDCDILKIEWTNKS